MTFLKPSTFEVLNNFDTYSIMQAPSLFIHFTIWLCFCKVQVPYCLPQLACMVTDNQDYEHGLLSSFIHKGIINKCHKGFRSSIVQKLFDCIFSAEGWLVLPCMGISCAGSGFSVWIRKTL